MIASISCSCEACILFGPVEASRLFRAQAKKAPKRDGGGKPKKLPPIKRKGGHDPEADYLLLLSWQTFNGSNKLRWAEMALTHHAVKNSGQGPIPEDRTPLAGASTEPNSEAEIRFETNRSAENQSLSVSPPIPI